MFSFFKRRAFLLLIGFVLIAAFIWYAGPYFAFADYYPLESVNARLIAIALVVAFWVVSRLLRRLRASLAGDRLVKAVIKQSHADEPAPSADVVKLREGFEHAVATLKERKRSHTLYDLPWYVFIGAARFRKDDGPPQLGTELRRGPGRWKGQAQGHRRHAQLRLVVYRRGDFSRHGGPLHDPGLRCELRQRRLEGIPHAPASVPAPPSDQRGHPHHQRERSDDAGASGREAQVEAARLRLRELNRELQIQLPVYVMVTMCDMVAGFAEYFDDLAQDTRAQVWGVTFPYEQTLNGESTQRFVPEFEALITRLNERLFTRLDEDRDVRRRTTVFAFPQQMAALRDPLAQFVE